MDASAEGDPGRPAEQLLRLAEAVRVPRLGWWPAHRRGRAVAADTEVGALCRQILRTAAQLHDPLVALPALRCLQERVCALDRLSPAGLSRAEARGAVAFRRAVFAATQAHATTQPFRSLEPGSAVPAPGAGGLWRQVGVGPHRYLMACWRGFRYVRLDDGSLASAPEPAARRFLRWEQAAPVSPPAAELCPD